MQITWLSYFGSENQGLPLRSWFVTCWLWRHIPIVTSLAVPSSCVVTQTPMETNSGTRRRKRKFPLLFVNCDRGRIEIDHLYGLRCRGWYCNAEQHSLCRPARPEAAARRPAQLVLFRIAVPTTPAQTVSWSIPIAILRFQIISKHNPLMALFYCSKAHRNKCPRSNDLVLDKDPGSVNRDNPSREFVINNGLKRNLTKPRLPVTSILVKELSCNFVQRTTVLTLLLRVQGCLGSYIITYVELLWHHQGVAMHVTNKIMHRFSTMQGLPSLASELRRQISTS